MQLLLALSALLTPTLASAQSAVRLYVHPHLYTLRPTARFYTSLSDTLTALPTQLIASQVVAATASNEYRWALVSNIIGCGVGGSCWTLISNSGTATTSWYVRRDDLIMVPKKRLLPAAHGLN